LRPASKARSPSGKKQIATTIAHTGKPALATWVAHFGQERVAIENSFMTGRVLQRLELKVYPLSLWIDHDDNDPRDTRD
jgi:hypothetical protein